MGVKQDFPKLLKTLSGGKIVIKNNSELKNRMWALDISIWMYQALSLKDIWSDAIMVPSVPMTKVVAIIMKKLDILKKWGITVLVVLDGSRNPKKAQTNKSRADAAELPKQTVEEILPLFLVLTTNWLTMFLEEGNQVYVFALLSLQKVVTSVSTEQQKVL